MKKIALLLLLFMGIVVSYSATLLANGEELIDLFPYRQEACLNSTNACTQTKLGNSNWQYIYNGHRYHVVRGSARYVTEFDDKNADGFIDATEMTALTWNAFASVIINDTAEGVVLKTANARTDLTSVVHRIYTYYDQTGKLTMFEDQILTYYIFNDGTVEAPDWRLATDAEKQAFIDAPADSKPVTTRFTHIRMKLDSADSNGYKLEPLAYITWRNADVLATEPKTEWSKVVTGDPELVTIPAGWTVISYGTLDRDGTTNPATTNYIKSLPAAMINSATAPLQLIYNHQPATFTGIVAMDDDLVTPGVNVVVEYNGAFDLPNDISVAWLNMFNPSGKIINSTEKLSYEVAISKDDVVLETITFTYNSETDSYTPSGPVTKINSSVFGAGYKATYKAVTPKGAETLVTIDIVIGVMPPRFSGVANRYGDQGIMVDLLQGITADDGYGNSKTDDIVVTYPAGFNPYNPLPGVYKIDLQFTHHIFIAGIAPTVTVKTEVVSWNPTLYFNKPVAVNDAAGVIKVWSDQALARTAGSAWGSVITIVAADGTLKERYDRYNWNYTTSTGTVVGDATLFAAWQANITLLPGEYVVAAHGSVHATRLRAANLAFGDPVVVVVGRPDFNYDIVTNASYTMTIDDTVAPVVLAVADNYRVEIGRFTNVNELILSNVTAFDNYNARQDIALFVSNNGGLNLNNPGTYAVTVTAEDIAGNASTVTFNVILTQPTITTASIQALIAAGTLTQAQIQALIDADMLTEAQVIALINQNAISQAQVQAMIDAAVEEAINELRDELTAEVETGCGRTAINVSAANLILPLIGMFTLAGIAFMKRFF